MATHPFDNLFAFFLNCFDHMEKHSALITFSNGLAPLETEPSILMAFAQLSRDMQQEEEHRFGL
jgi:hypothetical protein